MARIRALPPQYTKRFHPEDYFKPLKWENVFAVKHPVEIELGAGDGSFLIKYASKYPEINLLGIERLLGRIRKIDRDTHRAGVGNIQLFRIEAGYFLKYLAPGRSIRAVHVYVPDPWPKIRHHKKRLINEDFVKKCAGILEPGGMVHLRTDHPHYFDQMLDVFGRNECFKKSIPSESLIAIKTDFENHFNDQGIQTQYASYQLQK
jgi:tRNA (guanine-N7-)-methyltransferase